MVLIDSQPTQWPPVELFFRRSNRTLKRTATGSRHSPSRTGRSRDLPRSLSEDQTRQCSSLHHLRSLPTTCKGNGNNHQGRQEGRKGASNFPNSCTIRCEQCTIHDGKQDAHNHATHKTKHTLHAPCGMELPRHDTLNPCRERR